MSEAGEVYEGKRHDNPADYHRMWRAQNAEKVREYYRTYHHEHKDDPAYAEMRRKASRDARRKAKYGITRKEYEKHLTSQEGKCTICGEWFGEDLRVDHDHTTGEVRALLCTNCNSGIGLLNEDPERLKSAIRYLEQHR